jgi:hypothetical protein
MRLTGPWKNTRYGKGLFAFNRWPWVRAPAGSRHKSWINPVVAEYSRSDPRLISSDNGLLGTKITAQCLLASDETSSVSSARDRVTAG